MALEAKNVAKSRGGRNVLRDVTLHVEPAELLLITGPSGSGKTTLLHALANIDPPDEGAIAIDGAEYHYPLSAGAVPKLWPTVTLVFQQLALWPHLSLRRNLTLPLEAQGVNDYRERLNVLIAALDLAEFVDRWPSEASVGQRQRIAIARALLLAPKYLLLDEVFSAQDIESVIRICEVLDKVRAAGTGIVLVTHMLGLGVRWADHIVFLENGSVVEQGDATILTDPKTKRLADFVSLHEMARSKGRS